MLIDKERKIIIFKSFKTASSSFYDFISKQIVEDNNHYLVDDHISPNQLLDHRLIDDIGKYTKITLVRNPWDMVVSAYHWALNNEECPRVYSFRDFVFRDSEFDWKRNKQYWDNNLIDYYIRYENLAPDVKQFCEDFNFEYTPLKHLKRSASKKHYLEYYDDFRTFREVGRFYYDTIKTIGYNKFGLNYDVL